MAVAGSAFGVTFVGNRLIEIVALLSLACGLVTMPPRAARAASGIESFVADHVVPATEKSSGRGLELERVVVTGNSHVSDSAILSTLHLAIRDTVNVDILEKARLRLLREQPRLSTVDFSTRPGSSRGLIILDVAVTERKLIIFETGYGHHDTYGWFLTLLGLRVDPAYAHGTEYRLGLRLGFHISGLDGGFERRGKPGGFGWGGNFHLYSQEQIFFAGAGAPATGDSAGTSQYAREFRQKIGRSGAELFLLYRLRDSTRFTFGFQAETVRPDSSFKESKNGSEFGFADFPQSLQPDIRNTDITGLFFRVVRDTRDRPDYPQSGSFALLQVQSNSTLLGGDESFVKGEYDVRKHIGFGNWRVLSSRLAAGIVSRGTPYYERFFLGGMYSVRGFRGLSLSPPSGNDGFVIAGSEFRFPLLASTADVPPRLAGLVFIDAGIGWERDSALQSSDIEAAAGYGVRLRLPWIGTLGLDVGVPFTDGCLGFSF
jgi:outer membrane protein assembly factor BamA